MRIGRARYTQRFVANEHNVRHGRLEAGPRLRRVTQPRDTTSMLTVIGLPDFAPLGSEATTSKLA